MRVVDPHERLVGSVGEVGELLHLVGDEAEVLTLLDGPGLDVANTVGRYELRGVVDP